MRLKRLKLEFSSRIVYEVGQKINGWITLVCWAGLKLAVQDLDNLTLLNPNLATIVLEIVFLRYEADVL